MVCVMPRAVRGPAKPRQRPPHEFVLEALMPLKPEVRRMFSGFGVYVGDRIVFMLRDHQKSPRDNGVWLVLSDSTRPTDPELRREFPSIRPIELLRNKIGHWLLIPSDSPSFEMEALHACDLLLRHDSSPWTNPQIKTIVPTGWMRDYFGQGLTGGLGTERTPPMRN
jgi:hypothetical protein